jgi:hypothetical protein
VLHKYKYKNTRRGEKRGDLPKLISYMLFRCSVLVSNSLLVEVEVLEDAARGGNICPPTPSPVLLAAFAAVRDGRPNICFYSDTSITPLPLLMI